MNAFTRHMRNALKAGASFLNPGLTPVPAPMDARRWLMDAVMPLEDRIMLDAEPVATIAPASGLPEVLIGSNFVLDITFDNIPDGDPGSNVGYGPYVDLYIPHLGKDGGNSDPTDGVDFVGATYLGASVQSTLLTFDANGQATHPFARDSSGQFRVLTGAPGDQVVVLRLPFGSFTPGQPAVTIAAEFQLSPLADFAPDFSSADLEFSAQGGFALGRDPNNNPTVDPPILQPVPDSQTITPILVGLTKTSDAPRGETATGPNFVHTYTIDVNVAPQQQIQNLNVTDILSSNIVFLDATVTSGGGTITTQPTAGSVVTPGLDQLIVNFGSITGTAGVDAQIQVRFYVNDVSGDGGQPVLDPDSGASSVTLNDVKSEGTHIPLDPRDPQQQFTQDLLPVDNSIVNRSIAMRKDVVIVEDRNVAGLSPGDVLEYTLHVDLSDYFSFGDIVIQDILSRGQQLEGSFTPHLTLTERGVTTQADFTGNVQVGDQFVGPNVNMVYDSVTGLTTINFDVSGEIELQNLSGGDGVIEGGRTHPGDALLGVGPTMALLTFRTVVLSSAPDGQGGTVPIDQGDRVGNRATVQANVYPNGNPAGPPTGQQTDDDTASIRIQTGALSLKSVVAVNGDTDLFLGPNGMPQVTQGDTITFRLQYVLPTSSVTNFNLVDFLPLPVLTAQNLTFIPEGTIPAEGEFTFGPLDSFSDLTNAPTPTVTFDTDANAIRFNYGTYSFQDQAPGNQPITTVIDLLLTLRVNDMSYGDGLLLTNLLQGTESNSEGEQTITSVIAQFEVGEADIVIDKGVVDFAGNSAGSFVGSRQPSGVSFDGAAGNTSPAVFTGLITDAALATGLIDADLTGVDAGDKVTFAITVNNNGAGIRGAFDVTIKDLLPDGFEIPADAAGLNLKVTYGDGTSVAYTDLGGGLFGNGIRLVDGVDGALAADPAKGQGGTTTNDIVIITYDLVATAAVQPRQVWTNTASVDHFAGQEGGNNLVFNPITDDASVTISPVTATKVLQSTSESFTPGSDLAIGEVATFRLTYVLPEGQTRGLVLSDLLPLGAGGTLGNVSASIVSVGGAISGAGVPPAGSSIAFDSGTHSYIATFGDVSVNSGSTEADRTIVIEVNARASDVVENVRGLTPSNRADARYVTTNQDGSTDNYLESAQVGVRLVVPDLSIAKTANPTTIVEAGQIITYSLVISNPANAAGTTAFGLKMTDSDLAALGFTNITIQSIVSNGATNADAVADAAGVVTVTADSLDNGGLITVLFTVKSSPTLSAGAVLVNHATLDPYTTLAATSPDFATARILTESPVSAQVQLEGAGLTKTIFTTSVGNDTSPLVQIGEFVTFDLRITLPASVTPVTLSDFAPAGLVLQSAQLISIGGQTAAGATSGGNITGSQVAVGDTATVAGNAFTFNFGTLTIAEDGMFAISEADIITVRAIALVADVPGNVGKTIANQTSLVNNASVNFGIGTTNASSTVQVVEPSLTLLKQGNRPNIQAGETETYTVSVTNTGLGTAFDLILSDVLNPNLLLTGLITVEGPSAGAAVGSYASFADIPPITLAGNGAAFTVTYSAVVQDAALLGSGIPNVINASFDSLPGAGGRADSGSSQFVINITGPSTLTKEVIWTSINADADTNVQIGEIVEFRVVATIPNGTTNLQLSDTLPSGLQLVAGSVVLESFLGDTNYQSYTLDTVGQTTTLDFGTITNPAANSDDTIVFTLRATVQDIIGNVNGTVLLNSAQVWPLLLSPVVGTASVTVIEPDIRVNKIELSLNRQAGEVAFYLVEIRNLGTGTAFDLTITDPLAPELALVPGSIEVRGADAGSAEGTYNSFSDIHVDHLVAGGDFTITYRATVLDTARLGSTIVNTATAYYDSLPGEGDVGREPLVPPSDQAFITVSGPVSFDKTILTTSIGNDANPDVQIGERVTFRMVATLPDGTTNLNFNDTLPSGLQYVVGSFKAISMFGAAPPAGTLTEGPTVSIQFGQITNPSANPDNTVVLEIQAIVMDVPGNIAGTILTNDADVTTNLGVVADTRDVRIVDPVLTVGKSALVNGGLNGDAGDLVTYTVVVANDTAVSTGVAYDYVFADVLPAGVQLVGTPALSGSAAAGATLDLSLPNTVRVSGDSIALGDTLTIIYTARIIDTVQVPSSITNTGDIGYDTLPGAGGADRTASDDATIFITGDQAFVKTIVATDNPTTHAEQFDPTVDDVTIGETVTFNLVATLPEGVIGPVILTDSLLSPAGVGTLAPVAGSYTVTLNGSTTAITPTLTDTNGDGIADSLTFDLGTVTIDPDNDPGNNDIVISYQAIVPDVAANFAGPGRVQVQGASLSTPLGTLGAGTRLEVVEPKLQAVKTANVTSAQPGDIVTYTVTLRHTADSTAAAQDLNFTDLFAGGQLVLVPGSMVILSGPGTAGVNSVDISTLLLGEETVIRYQAILQPVAPGTVVTNTAVADFDSQPGNGGRPDTAIDSVDVTVPGFVKAITDTSNPDTGNIQFTPGAPDLTIGETVTYTLTVTLAAGVTNVSIADTLLGVGSTGLLQLAATPAIAFGTGVTASIPNPVLQETDTNGDGRTDALGWNFGTVTNSSGAASTLTITVVARAQDIPADAIPVGNGAGDILLLPATFNYGSGTIASSIIVDIVEPDLGIAKTVDVTEVDAGDPLTYTVVLTNNGTAPAYNVDLTDILPPNVSFTGAPVTVTGAFNGIFASLDAVAIARLMPGESVTVTYHAIVGDGVSPGDVLPNSAGAETSSLPADPEARDYMVGPVVAPVTVVGDYTLTKEIAVAGTSLVDTGEAAVRPGITDLAIGERATVVLTIGLAEGTVNQLVVEDLLASGGAQLGLLPGSITATHDGADVPVTILEIDDNNDGVTDRIRFDFGTFINPGDNDLTDNAIVITYTAIALNRPGNSSGDQLDLPATLTWSVPANPDNQQNASAGVDLVEPGLVIDKSFTPSTGEAGSLISYRLTIGNNGLGPVYDLGITDLADPGLNLVSGYTLTQGGVTTTVTSLADLPLLRLMPGETVTVDYVQQIGDSPLVGSTLVNTATVAGDSLPGVDPDERDAVPASDTAAITLTPTVPVQITKFIPVPSTDDPNTNAEQFRPDITDFTIGESGVVFLQVTLPKGTTGDVVVTDALASPAGLLGFKPGTVIASLGGVVLDPASYTVTAIDSDGDLRTDQLRFNFGDIVIPGSVDPSLHTLDIRYGVQVQNLLRNQPGDMLDLPVRLDYVTALGAAAQLTAQSGVDIVLGSPVTMKLSVKSEGDSGSLNGIGPAPGDLSGTAGDIFTYTLHIQHTDRATGPAYDLSVRDILPAGLELIAGSASVDIAGATLTTGADGLVVTLPQLLLDQSFNITYQARITDATLWNTELTNEVYLDFDSAAGPGGRPGGSSDSFTIESFGEATIRTDIVSTDNPNSGVGAVQPGVTDLGIGEQIVWRLTTTLNEGTTDSFIVTHRLPSGANGVISIESIAAPVLGAGITAERANPNAQLSDTDGDGIADTIVWDFGRVTNAGDNIIDARDTISIDVVGRVPDDPRNVQGDILDTGSEVDFGTATGPGYDVSGVPVAIVESALVIDKTVPPGDILPGNLIPYTIRVSNADYALLAASDIVITDLLQPGLTLEGPITIVSGPEGTVVNGTTVTTPLLPLGQEVVITYSARLAFDLDPTQPVVNTAVVTWDSQPGNGGRPGEATDSVVIDLLIPPPPTPNSIDEGARQSVENWIARRFIEVPTTTLYSGAAQPGARVVVQIQDALGGGAQMAAATADAGGNWIVRASGVTASSNHSDYSIEDYFASTRLFASADPMFHDHPDWAEDARSFAVPIGTHASLISRPITLVATQPAWALPGSDGDPIRLFYAPGQQGLSFASEGLTIDKVMREAASAAVAEAFARDQGGMAALNRFNAHSLGAGTN
ncbi:isopeptide-forming domain-containing fimbrial protein [Sandaracinobacteroides hominis]|uniref:isopeptide-forming domain-containing fimbrial protein n=1 Tax=Sandaracinobacteroides hominis TaxID=2780086 RepID=UPI0018F55EC4|nr:isopeptide-forming domain-containing fimbrial protein [Sandaracinobacteroides hominis]